MSSRRVNEYFSYKYSDDVTDAINAIRDDVMGPMPEREKWMNDEVHTTGVFVGSDRHLTSEETDQLVEEMAEFTETPIQFRVKGAVKGLKPVIFLELEYATPKSEVAYFGIYQRIFSFLRNAGFPQNMSFATYDTPPARHITLSWVPEDRVDEYLEKFQSHKGVIEMVGQTISTKSFQLVHNDGTIQRTFYPPQVVST